RPRHRQMHLVVVRGATVRDVASMISGDGEQPLAVPWCTCVRKPNMLNPLVMKTAPLMVDKKSLPVGGTGAAVLQRFTQPGNHCSSDFADTTCRFKQTNITAWTGLPGDTLLKGVFFLTLHPDAAGDTFFLPYGVNEIHSVKLPARPDLGRT